MVEPAVPRTLLEAFVRSRQLSWQEAADLVVDTARQHEKAVVSMSGRHLGRLARGERSGGLPYPATRRALQHTFGRPIDELLAPYVPGDLIGAAGAGPSPAPDASTRAAPALSNGLRPVVWQGMPSSEDDECDAVELARRVAASDVGDDTLGRLELVVDDLATKYPVTLPAELLDRVRHHLAFVAHLLDARTTLAQHRRLLVVGGWLSLLGATLHIDLVQPDAATARLRTAATLAQHAEHDEIHAWCYETEAWGVLTDGDYRRALELSQTAQQLAPRGSSVAIQATVQEGRARARLGQQRDTYHVIHRVTQLVAPLPKPDRPEHHYRYDPDKSVAYIATTLAWAGDPAAETYAREVIARVTTAEDAGKRPRRVAAANLDLALALLVTNRLDEACDAALEAVLSGRVVPSNHWRALEVVKAVEARDVPEAADLREAYEGLRRNEANP